MARWRRSSWRDSLETPPSSSVPCFVISHTPRARFRSCSLSVVLIISIRIRSTHTIPLRHRTRTLFHHRRRHLFRYHIRSSTPPPTAYSLPYHSPLFFFCSFFSFIPYCYSRRTSPLRPRSRSSPPRHAVDVQTYHALSIPPPLSLSLSHPSPPSRTHARNRYSLMLIAPSSIACLSLSLSTCVILLTIFFTRFYCTYPHITIP